MNKKEKKEKKNEKKGGKPTPNFRLRMCASDGTPLGVTSLLVALSVMRNGTTVLLL
jgi:hypothetical protein